PPAEAYSDLRRSSEIAWCNSAHIPESRIPEAASQPATRTIRPQQPRASISPRAKQCERIRITASLYIRRSSATASYLRLLVRRATSMSAKALYRCCSVLSFAALALTSAGQIAGAPGSFPQSPGASQRPPVTPPSAATPSAQAAGQTTAAAPGRPAYATSPLLD